MMNTKVPPQSELAVIADGVAALVGTRQFILIVNAPTDGLIYIVSPLRSDAMQSVLKELCKSDSIKETTIQSSSN